RMIQPNVRPDVTTLMNAGVRPTPGQIAGGPWNRVEEAAQSIPFVGDAIRGARNRAVEDLNRAAINRSLEPINAQLAPNQPLGRDAIAAMRDTIQQNYNNLVPHLSVQADQQFANDVAAIGRTHYARMSDPARAQFERIVDNDIFRRFGPGGVMTG